MKKKFNNRIGQLKKEMKNQIETITKLRNHIAELENVTATPPANCLNNKIDKLAENFNDRIGQLEKTAIIKSTIPDPMKLSKMEIYRDHGWERFSVNYKRAKAIRLKNKKNN